MNAILDLKIDLSCISNKLVKKLITLVDLDFLDTVKDRKDSLLSKIFMMKLELMIEDEQYKLLRCFHCDNLFTMSQHERLVCRRAGQQKVFIDV